MKETLQRIASAAIYAPLFIIAILYPSWGIYLFLPLILLPMLVSFLELRVLGKLHSVEISFWLIIPSIILWACYPLILHYSKQSTINVIIFMMAMQSIIPIFLTMIFLLFRFSQAHLPKFPQVAGWSLFSQYYVSIGFGSVLLIHQLPGGTYILLYLLLIAWMGDTGAYFVGRALGRTKLNWAVSPKKTLEGYIGGILTATILGTLYCILFIPVQANNILSTNSYMSIILIIVISIVLSVLSFAGDLLESALKRSANVKEIPLKFTIPGHGNVLDVFDSLIFISPWVLCYFIIQYILRLLAPEVP